VKNASIDGKSRTICVSLGLLHDSRTQGWGATQFISREIKEQEGEGGREKNKIMSLKRLDDGLTFSREKCRTGQSHSLFNLRSRRRYSHRLPYF
jgi:hypothetical protein